MLGAPPVRARAKTAKVASHEIGSYSLNIWSCYSSFDSKLATMVVSDARNRAYLRGAVHANDSGTSKRAAERVRRFFLERESTTMKHGVEPHGVAMMRLASFSRTHGPTGACHDPNCLIE